MKLGKTEPHHIEEGGYGDQVLLKCPAGYKTATGQFDGLITCQSNGSWSEVITCKRENLPVVVYLQHALYYPYFILKSVAEFIGKIAQFE